MKQRMKAFLSVILAVVLAAAFCTGSSAQAADSAGKEGTLTGADWMRGIADDALLYTINIPGTHDSAMAHCLNGTGNYVRMFGIPIVNSAEYACTQELTIPAQLEAGIRFFDLRFSPKAGYLRLCHGDLEDVEAVNKALFYVNMLHPALVLADLLGAPLVDLDTEFYAYEDAACTVESTFDTALAQMKAFLEAHPSEMLILKLKRENGEQEAYLKLLQPQIERLKAEVNPATGKPYLYTQGESGMYTEMPTLGTVRGQLVLLCPDAEALGCGDNLEMYNGTGMEQYMGMYFNFHNHWDVEAQQKAEEVRAYIESNAKDLKKGESVQYGSVLHTSSNVVMKDSPAAIEREVGAWLYKEGTLQKGHFYGWFLSDFMTAEKSAAIWQTNFE